MYPAIYFRTRQNGKNWVFSKNSVF